LEEQKAGKGPRLFETKKGNTKSWVITDCITVPIVTQEDMYKTLAIGTKKRHTAKTDQNQRSSRGHTIFVLNYLQTNPDDSTVKGRLNIVDLAGAEQVGKSQTVTKATKAEGA